MGGSLNGSPVNFNMKRTIIVSGIVVAGFIGVCGIFGSLTVLACTLLVVQNSLIAYGYYLSLQRDEIPKGELFDMLNASQRRESILELNNNIMARQIRRLEIANIELQRKTIDAERGQLLPADSL